MPRNVSELRPSGGSFESALADYRAARLQSCLRQLGRGDTVRERLLRARTLLRLREPDAALESLSNLTGAVDAERSEIALLTAVSLSRLGRNADEMIAEATTHANASGNFELRAEAIFFRALIAIGRGRLSDARTTCREGIAFLSIPRQQEETDHIIPLAHIWSRTYELTGFVHAAEGQYRSALSYAKLALSVYESGQVPDVYQESFFLRNLVILSRDFDLEKDVWGLSTRARKLEWTDDIAPIRCSTFEALGWCFALRGDVVESLRIFREAAFSATSPAEQVLLAVNRALIARSFGHQPMAFEEVEYAARVAFGFDWNTASGDLRDALLGLAQIAASIDANVARKALDRYDAISVGMDLNFAARLEDRVRAEEAYTRGVVLRAEGQIAASIERLIVAFSLWHKIGFEWRAARAALELAELDAGEPFLEFVREDLKVRPISIFARRAYEVAI